MRKTVIGNLFWLACLIVFGFVVMDAAERTRWFLLWAPLAVLMSVLMDYFVWNSPARAPTSAEPRPTSLRRVT